MQKIKTILLCGFLGAGKTTLLSRMLKSEELAGKKIAVLVNDFGALPVDAEILPEGEHFIAKINRGNIFCVCVKADLIKALENIADTIKPDILIIESTGLAEPSDFSSLLVTDNLKEKYIRDSIYCVVDALNFHKLATIMTAPIAQVQLADIVIINKTDLVDEKKISETKEIINKINQNCEILTAEYAKVKIKMIGNSEDQHSESGLAPCAPEDYERYEFVTDKIIDKIKLYTILEEYRNIILRAKGVIQFAEKRFFIEVVNGVVSSKPLSETNLKLKGYSTAISFILRENNFRAFSKKMDELK